MTSAVLSAVAGCFAARKKSVTAVTDDLQLVTRLVALLLVTSTLD